MKTCAVNALILGHKTLNDNDKLLFLYCEEFGKIRVIAKGAKKILSRTTGHLETLNLAKASLYFGPKNTILSEIQTIQYFPTIRENFHQLTTALQIAEITEKVVHEEQKIPKLLDLLNQTLEQISQTQDPQKLQLLTFAFSVKLLDKLGLIPNFQELDNKKKLPEKYLKFLHFSQKQTFPQIQKIQINQEESLEISRILKTLLETHCFSSINTFNTPSISSSFSTNLFKESSKR